MKPLWYLVYSLIIILYSTNVSLEKVKTWRLSRHGASSELSKSDFTTYDAKRHSPASADICQMERSTEQHVATNSREETYAASTEKGTTLRVSSESVKDPVTSTAPYGEAEFKRQPVVSLHDKKIGSHRLLGIRDLRTNLCDYPVTLDFVDFQNVTYSLCVSTRIWGGDAGIVIGTVKSEGLEMDNVHLNLTLPKDMASFVYNGNLFIIVADQAKAAGNELMEYDLNKGTVTEYKHTVKSRHASAVTIWKTDFDNEYYLAIANSAQAGALELKDKTYIYKWKGAYFDHISNITTYHVTDLEAFSIGSHSYLAVANHEYTSVQPIADSEIFQFDLDTRTWNSFQQIRTYAAMDWQFFTFGDNSDKEYFLAIANQLDNGENGFRAKTVIYKFINDKFLLFQCLDTVGASKIATFQGDNGEFLLAISNQHDALNLYQYDGWHFVATEVQYTMGMMGPGIVSIATRYVIRGDQKIAVLAVANSEEGPAALFQLEFERENKRDEWYRSCLGWCHAMKELVSRHDTEEIVTHFKGLNFVDQEDPIQLNSLTFKEFYGNTLITAAVEVDGFERYQYNLSVDLEDRFQAINEKIFLIEGLLNRALLTEGDQVITGEYSFAELAVECDEQAKCFANSIQAEVLNGEDISDLLDEIIFTDEDQAIETPLRASAIEAKNVTLSGRIDGLFTSDLVTKNGYHNITTAKCFQSLDARDISVSGRVDGREIHRDSVLLTKGDQTITGNITFDSIRVRELFVEQLLNGVNVTKFYSEVVLADGSYVINAGKSFDEVIIENLFINNNSLVNGINLEKLWDNALWLYSDQHISVPAMFGSVTIKGNVSAKSINGVLIPDGVLLTTCDFEINSIKTFTAVVTIAKLHVQDSINGIRVMTNNKTGEHQLDILLRTEDQIITGKKIFRNLHLESDVFVGGLVNGIKIETFFDDILEYRRRQLNGSVVFNDIILVNVKDIENLNQRLKNTLKLTDSEFNAVVVFKGDVIIDDLVCTHINGLEVPKDFVLKSGDQVIFGRKTFEHLEMNADGVVEGFINGTKLIFLKDALAVRGDQVVTGHKVIRGNLYAGSLRVHGLLNGVSTDSLLLLTSPLTINDLLFFERTEFKGHLNIQNLIIEGQLNGINVEDFLNNSLRYSVFQVVTGKKILHGNLHIVDGGNLNTSSFNGLDLSAIYDDTVLLNSHQMIWGRKVFQSNVFFHGLNFKDNFNGITEWDMKHNWMRQGTSQIVNGSFKFIKNVNFRGKLHVGTLNDQDIVQLSKDIIRMNDTSINAELFFQNVVTHEVELTGTINGMDLSEDMVLRNERMVSFGGRKNFKCIEVRGDVHVRGFINDVLVEEFCDSLSKNDENLGTLVVVGRVVFISNLLVKGLVNGWNLTELYNVSKTSVEYTHFDVLVIEEPLFVEGLLCGIDVMELNKTYFSLTRDQRVSGLYVFQNTITLAGILETRNMSVEGNIDGIDIDNLANSVLKTVGNQIVHTRLSFDSAVTVEDMIVYGKVNQLSIPEGVLLRNRSGDIHVRGTKILTSPVLVEGNVYMDDGATVKGIDISEWEKNSIFVDSVDKNVTASKIFSRLTVDDIWVHGLLESMNLSDCLTSVRIESVADVRRMIGNIVVQSLQINGSINGVSIEQLVNSTLRIDKTSILRSSVNFTSPVHVTHLIVNGSVNNFHVSELDEELNEIYENITRHRMIIYSLTEVIRNQAVILLYYDEVQVFREQRPYFMLGAKISGDYKLIISSGPSCDNCPYLSFYDWDSEGGMFAKRSQDLLAIRAVDAAVINYKGDTLLAVSSVKKYSREKHGQTDRLQSTAHVFVWDKTRDRFELFQNITAIPSVDVEGYVLEGMVCFAFCQVHEAALVEIYCTDDLKRRFQLQQRIVTETPRKVSITSYKNSTFLAIAKSHIEYHHPECSIDVYQWDKTSRKFIRSQTLSNNYVSTLLLIPYVTQDEDYLFLTVGESRAPNKKYAPLLTVYSYYKGHFAVYQKIGGLAVVRLSYLVLHSNGDLLLFVLTESNSGNLKVYRHQGASKFMLQHSMTFEGGETLDAFQMFSSDHYLVLTRNSQDTCNSERSDYITGILLKSKMKGKGRL